MNNIIYKYPLIILDQQCVEMPRRAQLLHVGQQDGKLTIWVLASSDADKVDRIISIYGAGRDLSYMPEIGQYVGTVQMWDGLVWHIFDLGEEK